MPELIDRQASLKKMCQTCGYCESFEKAMRATHPNFVTDKCNSYKFLAEQPTIEAEPVRHGRWIYSGYGEYPTCSCCKQSDTYAGGYCGNCGADMRDEGADNG